MKIRVKDLPEFDVAEHLDDDEAIAEYIKAMAEEDDSTLLVAALCDVARAKGMLDEGNPDPGLDAIVRLCTALGLKLTVRAA